MLWLIIYISIGSYLQTENVIIDNEDSKKGGICFQNDANNAYFVIRKIILKKSR